MGEDRIVPLLWIGNRLGCSPPHWQTVPSADEAMDWLGGAAADVVVVACPLPDARAADLLEELLRVRPGALVLIADETASVADAVRYLRLGAHDVAGPGDDIVALAEAALELRRGQTEADAGATEEPWRKILVGSSSAIERTAEVIRLVGGRRSTVLITGETGTGKEVVARALHLASPRAHMPMVAVNCNALPENLLEAELFGHVKGAFTGAIHQRVGRFEQANHSTLFLDEIGDLPLDIQAKLLRFLQEREFQRVGSSETIHVDIRLIAATHVNLPERIRQGTFREDLYYRLNVVPISTPPLRERPEDVAVLARHFLEKICRTEDIPAPQLTPETLARLKGYAWPGNVRQLENAVEMAVAMSGGRPSLFPSDFPTLTDLRPAAPAREIALPEGGMDFDRTIGQIELQILEEALRKAGGNKTAAAEMLGLKRTTLAAKLRSLAAAI